METVAEIANNSKMSNLDLQDKAWLHDQLAKLPHGERRKVAGAARVTATQLSRMANIDPHAPPKNTQNIPLAKLRLFAEYFKSTPPGLMDPSLGTGGFLLAAHEISRDEVLLIRPEGPEASEVEPAENAPRLSEFGDFDVEVRGITVGGADDEFYFNGDVTDHVRRPPGIRRAKNVFALNVSGDSMLPRYEPGEPIYVQRTNPAIGDYVVIELYPEDDDRAGKSFLKQLVRRTGRRVTCKQFNPAKEVEFDAGEIKEIYRVLKPRELLG